MDLAVLVVAVTLVFGVAVRVVVGLGDGDVGTAQPAENHCENRHQMA